MWHHHRLDYDLEGVYLGDASLMKDMPSPPPLPPTPPPPPPKEKDPEPVREFVAEDGAERLKTLEEEARKSQYGEYVSHVKYSEIDWTISSKEFYGGKCLVKGINCRTTYETARHPAAHFQTKKHLDWEEEMRKKAEAKAPMAVNQPIPPARPADTNKCQTKVW